MHCAFCVLASRHSTKCNPAPAAISNFHITHSHFACICEGFPHCVAFLCLILSFDWSSSVCSEIHWLKSAFHHCERVFSPNTRINSGCQLMIIAVMMMVLLVLELQIQSCSSCSPHGHLITSCQAPQMCSGITSCSSSRLWWSSPRLTVNYKPHRHPETDTSSHCDSHPTPLMQSLFSLILPFI